MEANDVISLVVSCAVALSGIAAAAMGARAARAGASISSQAAIRGPVESDHRKAQRTAYAEALATLYDYLDSVGPALRAGEKLEWWANDHLVGENSASLDMFGRARDEVSSAASPWPSRLSLAVVRLQGPESVARAAKSVEAALEAFLEALSGAGEVWEEGESRDTHHETQGVGTCRLRHDELMQRVRALTDVASSSLNAPVVS